MEKTSEHALTLGFRALAYVVSRENLIETLMRTTGLGAQDIRNQAQDPCFLGAVLDFLIAREADLLDFCEMEDYKPETLLRLRAGMPGGPADLWV